MTLTEVKCMGGIENGFEFQNFMCGMTLSEIHCNPKFESMCISSAHTCIHMK